LLRKIRSRQRNYSIKQGEKVQEMEYNNENTRKPEGIIPEMLHASSKFSQKIRQRK
jgi:hypothetical protein